MNSRPQRSVKVRIWDGHELEVELVHGLARRCRGSSSRIIVDHAEFSECGKFCCHSEDLVVPKNAKSQNFSAARGILRFECYSVLACGQMINQNQIVTNSRTSGQFSAKKASQNRSVETFSLILGSWVSWTGSIYQIYGIFSWKKILGCGKFSLKHPFSCKFRYWYASFSLFMCDFFWAVHKKSDLLISDVSGSAWLAA